METPGTTSRFAMQIHPAWRPLLLVAGATEANSFAEVSADSVHFKYGQMFDGTISRKDISEVKKVSWWGGVGSPFGRIGLLGSHHNVIRVDLRRRATGLGIFPTDSIAISLKDPTGFLAALGVLEA